MEKIPTAEEFISGKPLGFSDVEYWLTEFAKLHVTAALKAAAAAADVTAESYQSSQEGSTCEIDTETILSAYPLTNIE